MKLMGRLKVCKLAQKNMLMRSAILLGILVLATPAFALKEFYVDPDWTGIQSGSSSQPWAYLNSSAWNAINSALNSDSVTVYFSAREANSDINEIYGSTLVISRTNCTDYTLGCNRLILDGMSRYNTDDLKPSWSFYSGSSRCEIRPSTSIGITSANTNVSGTDGAQRNFVTIRGFKINPPNGQIMILKEFNEGIVEYCELTTQAGSSSGPGFLLANNYKGRGDQHTHNFIFRNNTVHDTFGECVYLSGCYGAADNPYYSTCTEGNDNILIENNNIYNCGARGGGKDGVDIKNGNSHVIVRGNTISAQTVTTGDDQAGITTHAAGGSVFEGNFIYGVTPGAMRQSCININDGPAGYDVVFPLNGGLDVRNNVLVNCGSTYASWNAGIYLYSNGSHYDFSNVNIHNNSIFNAYGNGIYVSSGCSTVNVINNIISACGSTEFYAAAGTLGVHDHNNYYDTKGNIFQFGAATVAYNGSLAAQEAHSISSNPEYVSQVSPYNAENFATQIGSPTLGKGFELTGFTNDYRGSVRMAPWSIGAFQSPDDNKPVQEPSIPSNLTVIKR